jgi:hypothetical protein
MLEHKIFSSNSKPQEIRQLIILLVEGYTSTIANPVALSMIIAKGMVRNTVNKVTVGDFITDMIIEKKQIEDKYRERDDLYMYLNALESFGDFSFFLIKNPNLSVEEIIKIDKETPKYIYDFKPSNRYKEFIKSLMTGQVGKAYAIIKSIDTSKHDTICEMFLENTKGRKR